VIDALRRNFHQNHALQCGYCTPAMLIAARDLILRQRAGSEPEIREGLAGNICRCTGYTNIVTAIAQTAKELGREAANA
jgi:carbon-monoxide dehydrogenase small subunit